MHLCVQYDLARLTACMAVKPTRSNCYCFDGIRSRSAQASHDLSSCLPSVARFRSFFNHFFADFLCLSYVCLNFSFFLFCFETIRSFSFIFPLIIFTLRSAFEKHLKCLPTLNPEIASDSYLCSIDPLFVLG